MSPTKIDPRIPEFMHGDLGKGLPDVSLDDFMWPGVDPFDDTWSTDKFAEIEHDLVSPEHMLQIVVREIVACHPSDSDATGIDGRVKRIVADLLGGDVPASRGRPTETKDDEILKAIAMEYRTDIVSGVERRRFLGLYADVAAKFPVEANYIDPDARKSRITSLRKKFYAEMDHIMVSLDPLTERRVQFNAEVRSLLKTLAELGIIKSATKPTI